LAILLIIFAVWIFVLLLTIALCRAARAGDRQRTISSQGRRLSPRRLVQRARPRARRSTTEHAQRAAVVVAPERRSSHAHPHSQKSPDRLG
jgi:hypothetical protein